VIVPNVLQQHADDVVALAAGRHALTTAPYVNLSRLRRADQRLMAHLDGLRLAGAEADALFRGMREQLSSGSVFALSLAALQRRDWVALEGILAIVQSLPETLDGLLGAFGWLEPSQLQGIAPWLLESREPFRRVVGISLCVIHGLDPGLAAARYVHDPDAAVRARAVRAAGELGIRELHTACLGAIANDPDVRPWAAWSGVLLGDRHRALDVLAEYAVQPGEHRDAYFRLMLQAMMLPSAHSFLHHVSQQSGNVPRILAGSGIVGDPVYVPWLIRQMEEPIRARRAGEAFTLITGVNLGAQALDRPAPPAVTSGPTDDPDDPDVAVDLDDGLSWPDAENIRLWWDANGGRFQPGARYFMGEAVTRAHCIDVLKNGHQRQRIMAAHYLCLLDPGTPLFNTSAPAGRQQRLLAQMS
jgi:uncharacterized protein (TIGR02270 family)